MSKVKDYIIEQSNTWDDTDYGAPMTMAEYAEIDPYHYTDAPETEDDE